MYGDKPTESDLSNGVISDFLSPSEVGVPGKDGANLREPKKSVAGTEVPEGAGPDLGAGMPRDTPHDVKVPEVPQKFRQVQRQVPAVPTPKRGVGDRGNRNEGEVMSSLQAPSVFEVRRAGWRTKAEEKAFLARFHRKHSRGLGCWRWAAALTDGYGRFRVGARSERAHRLSWEIHRGPIPAGMQVEHTCGHRGCVNPSHLALAENSHRDGTLVALGRAHSPANLARLKAKQRGAW